MPHGNKLWIKSNIYVLFNKDSELCNLKNSMTFTVWNSDSVTLQSCCWNYFKLIISPLKLNVLSNIQITRMDKGFSCKVLHQIMIENLFPKLKENVSQLEGCSRDLKQILLRKATEMPEIRESIRLHPLREYFIQIT